MRNVSVLAGGTVIGQAIGVLSLPFLSRIYSPEDFGALGVFVAFLGMISVIAGLRYELAIPLPTSDQNAANLLAVVLFCVAVVTLISSAITFLFSHQIAILVNTPSLAGALWLLPIAVATTGAYSGFQFWATRKKAFKRIAHTRVEQSISGVATQLLLGCAGVGPLGLIVGQVVMNSSGLLGLGRHAFKEDRIALNGIQVAKMKAVARRYERFPKYSTFEALANTAGIQLPVIIVANMMFSAEVGFLMLAMKVMQAPMSLIGKSISQVYLSCAVEEHRNDQLSDFTARTIGGLIKVGVGPILFAGIVAPLVFGLVFGLKWERSGELISWMAPWFVFQFIAAPIAMALHVTNNQRIALGLQVTGLLIRVLMVLAAGAVLSGEYVSEVFALSGFLFYVIYLSVVCRVVNISFADGVKVFKGSSFFVFAWVFSAIIVRVVFVIF